FTEKALPRPDIAFRLTTDGSLRLDLPKTESLKERFISALELKQPPELFSIISGEDPSSAKDWSFKLVIGEPSVYRNDRKQIFIYVNGRRVTEYSLVQAVEYGCQGFFPNGTHPVAALFVQMNPALVDFNIHPAKKEVRFKDSSALHHGVSSMTHSYFRASGIRSSSQSISSGNESYRPEREFDFSTPSVPSFNTSAVSPVQRMKNYDTSSFKSSFSSFPVMDSIPSDLASQALYSEAVNPSQEDFPAEETESAFTFIGTALGTFILIQVSDTLCFIDQHAAHERIIFDGLIKDGGEKQNLLIPYEIHTDSDEDDAYISSACSSLLHAGFTFEKAGKGIWNVTTVPLRWTGTQQELEDCLFDKRTESQDILYKIAAMTACKAAVKDGYELDRDEAEKIAQKALKLPDPHCPHGRPVWTTISKAKLFEMVRRTR
ncbi:MAG: DNA mismatch repair protein MutL, partial [Treponema sp.]|nr:DNA mismatch repair protein MutL [Treponema sp.]